MTLDEIWIEVNKQVKDGWLLREKFDDFALIYSNFIAPPIFAINAAETGVFYGKSAIAQGLIIKHFGLNCKLYAVDAWSAEVATEGTQNEANREWWARIDYDKAYNSFIASISHFELEDIVIPIKGKSEEVTHLIPANISILHLDSAHTKEVITKELQLYSVKMKQGSYLVCDDVAWIDAAAAYAKVPDYGFELAKEFVSATGESYNIYIKK